MAGRDKGGGLVETVGGVSIAQLGQGDIAAPSGQFGRIQRMSVLGFLRLLFEFVSLAEGREFSLLRLVEQSIGFRESARVNGAFRRTD